MKIIRKTNIILTVVAVLMMVVFVSPELASATDPRVVSGNPHCKDIDHCGEHETKIEPVPLGTSRHKLEDNVNYVTIKVTESKEKEESGEKEPIKFSWRSTLGICAVIVKGGTEGANVYEYDPLVFSDKGLTTPTLQGISHIIFCYSECPPPECTITALDVCENSTENTASVPDAGSGATYDWTIVGGTITSDKPYTNSITWNAGAAGTATISVTITDTNGCKSTCKKEVTIYSLPECIITALDVCENSTGNTASVPDAGSGATYDWTIVGGTITSDKPYKNSITWNAGAAGTATLTLTVTDSKGCTTTCFVDVTVDPCEEPECPTCSIAPVEAVCEDDGVVFSLDATIDPKDYTSYNLLWSDGGAGGTFSDASIEDPTWTPPAGFTGTATLTLTVTANDCESTCTVDVTVYPKPVCIIAGVEPICAGESVQLYAAVNGGTPGYTYSWDDGVVGGTFSDSNIEDPTWTPPSGFTGIATLTLTVTDSKGCTTTCFVDVIVKHCEKKPCKCSLVVQKRDEAGNPIDGAVFEVDGIEKTTSGGEARWDNLECNTTYEVKEISPEKVTRSITLGDCGERSTMRVVNKIEEGELEVLGIMEVLPFTGPAIPYSPFIGISTVLAGTFLYILSKPKKKR